MHKYAPKNPTHQFQQVSATNSLVKQTGQNSFIQKKTLFEQSNVKESTLTCHVFAFDQNELRCNSVGLY